MFKELGASIDKIILKEVAGRFDSDKLIKIINIFCHNMVCISSSQIKFGRYLAYESENCNIQDDIFSQNYEGQIHAHETWGALGIVSGNFIIRDYTNESNKIVKIRTNFVSKGSVSYFPQISDIHSLESLKDTQGVSIHVYGKDFDINNGIKYSKKTCQWETYTRSALGDFREIESNFEFLDM